MTGVGVNLVEQQEECLTPKCYYLLTPFVLVRRGGITIKLHVDLKQTKIHVHNNFLGKTSYHTKQQYTHTITT